MFKLRAVKDLVSMLYPSVYKGERHNCLQGARLLRDKLEERGIKMQLRLKLSLNGLHVYCARNRLRADYGIPKRAGAARKLRFNRRCDGWDADRWITIS